MKTYFVLYDMDCGFCCMCKRWLQKQPAYVPLVFVGRQSRTAAEKFGRVVDPNEPEEMVVVSSDGEVYRGTSAYLVCLWALRSYRDWDRLIRALPGQITDILDQAQSGDISVQLQISRLDRITNRLIFGLIATGLIVASAMLWSAGVGPMFEDFSLIGAAGIVLALYIVIRLWRAIERSGGL